jgi:hypothetical protein
LGGAAGNGLVVLVHRSVLNASVSWSHFRITVNSAKEKIPTSRTNRDSRKQRMNTTGQALLRNRRRSSQLRPDDVDALYLCIAFCKGSTASAYF